jgi:hypothetical protein
VNNFKAIGNCVWIVLVCGQFSVEQANKVIGASKLTPWLHGGCIKIEKHIQSSHKFITVSLPKRFRNGRFTSETAVRRFQK